MADVTPVLDGLEKLAKALRDRVAEPDGWCEANLLLPAADGMEALIALARRAAPGGGEDAEVIVTRWANWIIDQSADFDDVADHDAGRRKIMDERDLILSAIRSNAGE